jgi:RNA polymerase sigma factor (sigma-70 family)
LNSILHYLRQAACSGAGNGLSDAQLLESFLKWHDEAAFESLVIRHGPMVLAVCRRILGNHHDAEDVFQATFLVLVRKAASIRPRDLVGPWLHGVVLRTALKARAMSARRHMKEKHLAKLGQSTSPDEDWQELVPHLDHELERLPDKYRIPVVLRGHRSAGQRAIRPSGARTKAGREPRGGVQKG